MTTKRQLAAALRDAQAEIKRLNRAGERVAGHRDFLAWQNAQLLARNAVLENDIVEWRDIASDNYRLYIDAKYTPVDGEQQPRLTLLEGGRPRDERGRFTKAAGQ